MDVFKKEFAQYNSQKGQYYFSNVRNGLLVGLVGLSFLTLNYSSLIIDLIRSPSAL